MTGWCLFEAQRRVTSSTLWRELSSTFTTASQNPREAGFNLSQRRYTVTLYSIHSHVG